jgi:endonuclease/exonuclease/phosphatase family metal-dependent hydrolase
MKILTANIAYGFKGMDRLGSSIRHQLHIHGPGILTYEFLPGLRSLSPVVSEAKRVAYVKKNQHLEPVFELIRRTEPDVLVLNEVIYEVYRERVEQELYAMGFQTIAWGVSTHYPGTSISTLLATKERGEIIPCTMPQRPSMGGGAGMTGIRLKDKALSLFGMHLTYRNPSMFIKQLGYIAVMARNEKSKGKEVALVGDFNESEPTVCANPDFKSLGLISADPQEKLTCPTFLPRFMQKPLDHTFIPANWKRKHAQTMAFGSDHLALLIEAEA